jgi:hypothetical protein
MSDQEPQLQGEERQRLQWEKWKEDNVGPSVALPICIKRSLVLQGTLDQRLCS